MALLAEAELFDQSAVALEVASLEVVQEATAFADQHQQATPRVVIFALLAQVLGEVVDALGEQRDLDLGGPGVLLVCAELRGDLALALAGDGGHGSGTVADDRLRFSARL